MSFKFFLLFAWQLFGPDPPIVVSRETTYLTEPLLADGLPNYEKYFREKMREGVTPENNAAVLLLQAIGPRKMKPDEFAAVAQEIGLDRNKVAEPPLEEYMGKLNEGRVDDWLRSIPKNSESAGLTADDILEAAMRQPWTSKQIPPLADWVTRNQETLDLVVIASKRPRFYAPSAKLLDDKYDVTSQFSPELSITGREVARALSARAMWHLGEGRHQKAWDDLLAVYRISRLFGQSGKPLIDVLVAVAMEGLAMKGTAMLLSDPQLSAEVARDIRLDLAELGSAYSFADTFQDSERIMWLGSQLHFRSRGLRDLAWIGVDEPLLTAAKSVTFDWNNVLIRTNRLIDELVMAATLPTWAEQQEALDGIEKQIIADPAKPHELAIALLDRGFRSKLLSDYFYSLFHSASAAACEAGIRGSAHHRLVTVASALAQYQAKHGRYPQELSELVPTIVDQLPSDPYDGGPLSYRRTHNGYLLYARGENCKDDLGNSIWLETYHGYHTDPQLHDQVKALLGDEMPKLPESPKPNSEEVPYDGNDFLSNPLLDAIPSEADDIAIRVPLPKLELPKAK